MDAQTADEVAVQMVFEPGRCIIQYRPALDPVGRHWDGVIHGLHVMWPDMSEASWDMLEDPEIVLGEGTLDETHFYVTTLPHNDHLVGTIRSQALQEQTEIFLDQREVAW